MIEQIKYHPAICLKKGKEKEESSYSDKNKMKMVLQNFDKGRDAKAHNSNQKAKAKFWVQQYNRGSGRKVKCMTQ